MPEHDPRHDEIIQAMLAGDLSPEEARAQLEGDVVAEEKLMELEVVRDLLELSGSGSGPSSEELPAFAAGEAAARERLRALAAAEFGETRAPRRTPRLALLIGSLAAAAALLFVVSRVLERSPQPAPPDDVFISGDGELMLITPGAAPVAREGLVFEWEGELKERGDLFELRIQDKEGYELQPSPVRVREARWQPTQEDVAAWPDEIRLQISVEVAGFDDTEAISSWQVVRFFR